jgi:hypothetical protein
MGTQGSGMRNQGTRKGGRESSSAASVVPKKTCALYAGRLLNWRYPSSRFGILVSLDVWYIAGLRYRTHGRRSGTETRW